MQEDEYSYVGENYPKYFTTDHWYYLKQQLIYSNANAHCWICEKTDTLLIHHVKYDNLFNERLKRDIYVLCFDCHTQVHFYTFLHFFKKKTKLVKRKLVRRMILLRILYLLNSKRFIKAGLYIPRYMFIV